MTILESLHKVAAAEAHKPGALLWAELRDKVAAELAKMAARAAAGAPPAILSAATSANDLGVGVTLTPTMVDAAIAASYAAAKPAPAGNTPGERAAAMRANEREQMIDALVAGLEAGGYVVEVAAA